MGQLPPATLSQVQCHRDFVLLLNQRLTPSVVEQAHSRGTLQALRAACRPRLLLRFMELGVPGAIMMSAVRACQRTPSGFGH